MHKMLLAFGCLILLSPFALAQSERRAEFFIGYSNLQAEGIPDRDDPNDVLAGDFFERRGTLHGVNAALTGFLSSWFGVTGDFSFNRKRDKTNFTNGRDSIDTDVYYFMGGPTIKARNASRFEPFGRVLAGGAHTRFDVSSRRDVTGGTVTNSFDTSSTDFAMAVGGGLDIRLGDRFSIRAFQVDYAPVFLRDRTINVLGGAGAIQPVTLEGQRQDNWRFSVGLVF